MNSKRWIAIVAVIVLLFISIGVRFTMSIAFEMFDTVSMLSGPDLTEEIVEEGSFTEKIAVVHLNGIIMDDLNLSPFFIEGYNHQTFIEQLEQAANDPFVEAVLLRINSPGGEVSPTDEIYRKVLEIQEEYGKPVYVSMGAYTASGGYYVAASADKIFAETSTITGSIGVIMENINFAELAENYGITFNTIKSGKHKDIMSQTREMTDEERDILQSIIDEIYSDFVQVIVDGRGLDEAHVREIGDGRIYTGRQAQEVGLVDEVGTFDDALTALKQDYGLEDAQVIEYADDFGFFSSFGLKLKQILPSTKSEIDTILHLLQYSDQPRLMYLFE